MDQRILQLYTVLADGKSIRKSEVAKRFGVSERTIQRDLSELRLFLADMTPETGIQRDLVYDRKDKCYRVEPPLHSSFSNSEAYTVAKILLESRALNREELDSILEKLVECCYPPLERKVVEGLLNNERFLYLEPKHRKPMTDLVWRLGRAVDRRQVLEVDYYRNSDGTVVHRVLQPVGILFDSFYFYLIAYYDPEDEVFKRRGMKSQEYPNTYRIDRIEKVCRGGKGVPGSLREPVPGGRVPQAGALHVYRPFGHGQLLVPQGLPGGGAGQTAHRSGEQSGGGLDLRHRGSPRRRRAHVAERPGGACPGCGVQDGAPPRQMMA